MRCYGCGGEDGTESILCPECRKKRALYQFSFKEYLTDFYRFDLKETLPDISFSMPRAVFGIVLLVTVSGFYRYGLTELPDFLMSTESRVLNRCLSGAAQALEAKSRGEAFMPAERDLLGQDGVLRRLLTSQFGEQEGYTMYQMLLEGNGTPCDQLHEICGRPEVAASCAETLSAVSSN